MSAEPHMASAPAPAKDHTTTVVGPTTSSPSPNHKPTGSTSSSAAGPATTTTASVGATPSSPGGTHEQLAQLLAKAYSDIDGLHRELSQTKRRAEQAERVAQRLTAVADASSSSPNNANGNGTGVVSEHVTRIIRELEDRLSHSEMAREEAEVRRRFVMDQWIQVENYLGQLEVKVQEAKFGFMRVLREGVPVSLTQPNLHAPQGIRRPRTPSLEGGYPPLKRSRGNDGLGREPRIAYSDSNIHDYNRHHHHHHPSTSSTGHPQPPPPQAPQHHVRLIHQPGGGSGGGTGRPRSTSRSSTSSIDVDEMLLQASTADDSTHPHPNGVSNIGVGGTLQAQGSVHISSGHRSRSGRTQQSTLRLGEGETLPHSHSGVYMSTGAGGGGRRGGQGSGSGMEVYPASQSVPRQGSLGIAGAGPGMAQVGGQQQVYQTHIFAPPVTGAPVKKAKYGSAGSVDPPSNQTALTPSASAAILATNSTLTSSASTAALGAAAAANSVLSGPNFPPTNEQGQRICRQCGQAGRYKDGKCVEKWGPGPAGPGTVCDRCRKKMKRVERRGTLESQQQLAAAHLAAVNVVHAHHGSMGPPVQQHQPTQHHTGLTRTDTLPTSTNTSANTTTNAKGSSKMSHVRTIMHASGTPGSTSATPSKREREKDHQQQATSNVRSRGGNASSAPSSRGAAAANAAPAAATNNNGSDNNRMQIDSNVSGESDADADADGEGDEGGESIVVPANATLPFKRVGGGPAAAGAEEEEEEDVDDMIGADDSGEGDDADAEAEILDAVDAAEESQ